MKAPLTLGIAGLGTVGAGLVRLLAEHRERLAAMLGREITIVAVSGRDRNKARGCDVSKFHWFDDPVKLATAPGITVVNIDNGYGAGHLAAQIAAPRRTAQ